ncbi:hypothetical protein MCGE09_00426 [Thaumarchaeota archaeon SCGC AB-539-E09]|nr:hypothetical protein MCGE09_00426 [Thaumarchaeota archaeon SCGC AB-539-E09]
MKLFQRKSRFFLLGTLWLFGILLLVLDYLIPFRGALSYTQFWTGILLCMISALILLLDNDFSCRGKVFVLFNWGATLYLPKVLRSPFFLNLQDELLHFQTLKLIYESGTLNITPTIFEVSKYYPGLELLTLPIKLVTNLSLFHTAILLIGFIQSLLPVFIFLIFKNITLSERISALGAFIFTSNTSFFCLDSMFSYESLGIFFVVVLLLLIFKTSCTTEFQLFFSFLSLIVVTSLIITHHFSSYMFLSFSIILVAVQYYKNTTNKAITGYKSHIRFTLLTIISISAWLTYVATITINYLGGIFIDRIKHIVSFSILGEKRELFWQSSLPVYEVFIGYLYIPLILLLSGFGIHYLHNKDKIQNIYVYSFIVYGPLLYCLSLLLIPTYSQDIANRSWPFLFIGVSFVVAHSLDNVVRQRNFLIKIFTFIAVVLVMIGGISLGDNPSGRFLGSINLVSGPATITSDVIYASNWFEEKNGRYNKIIGDSTIHWVFGGYGVQDATTWEAWKVFFPKTINDTVIYTLKNYEIQYVIVDKRITEFLAKYKCYFNRVELNIKKHPGYGRTKPLPKECIEKFDNSIFFTRVYSNDNIIIYKINT